MFGKAHFWLGLAGAVVAAVVTSKCVVGVDIVSSASAQVNFTNDGRYRPRQTRPRGGNFFERLFGGPFNGPSRQYVPDGAQHGDYSRAPPPPKRDGDVAPATSIMVMGDGMADWLAYGLEDAFSETPEIAIVRENQRGSGLVRYDRKSDIDWWHQAREILAKEKADYIVVMLGIRDRQNIREKDVVEQAEKEAEEKQKQAQEAVQRALENAPGTAKEDNAGNDSGKQNADSQDQSGKSDQKKVATSEPKKRKSSNAVFEFRSDQWEKIYVRRIDQMIAALKGKGVPVFWVGLPSIRGTRSTADAVYLNDLFRARAERAGIVYVDVWDGFVDESGKYSSYGPDYEGQTRRLRSSDGVYFTRYGARKLAHYVEREIRRFMNNRAVPVALPTGPLGPLPDGRPGVRPVAGPVIPLTVTPLINEALAGAPGRHRVHGDATAADALVRGDPLDAPPGRADDFVWPPGSSANRPPPAAPEQPKPSQQPKASGVRDVTPLAVVPNASTDISPPKVPAATAAQPAAARSGASINGTATQDAATTKPASEPASAAAGNAASGREAEIRPPQPVQNAPPRPVRRSSSPFDTLFGRSGPFGWIPR